MNCLPARNIQGLDFGVTRGSSWPEYQAEMIAHL